MSYFSADVKCPFYEHDNVKESTITCEGIVPGSTIKSHFTGKAALTKTIRTYCAGGYESCPWYKVASMKWSEK